MALIKGIASSLALENIWSLPVTQFQICVLSQLIVGGKAGAYYQHINFTTWTSGKELKIT